MLLDSELVLELTVEIGEKIEVGNTLQGFLRIIPILGGELFGPSIKGKVLPGGADWNTILDEKTNHVFAKYWVQTDDGCIISIENEGYTDQLRTDSQIRTIPQFQVDKNSKYASLLSGVFVGSLRPSSKVTSGVDLKIFKMK